MAPLVRLEGASGSGRSVFHCEELQHRLAFISQEQVQQGYVPAPPPTGFFGLATGAPAAAPEPAAAPMDEFTPEKAPPPCPRKCATRLVPHGRASGPRSQHLRPAAPAGPAASTSAQPRPPTPLRLSQVDLWWLEEAEPPRPTAFAPVPAPPCRSRPALALHQHDAARAPLRATPSSLGATRPRQPRPMYRGQGQECLGHASKGLKVLL